MSNTFEYLCTKCGKPTPRDQLYVKKVIYLEMGKEAESLRSRTQDWLCESCLRKDEPWNIPSHTSPGSRYRKAHPDATAG